ncbi:MAG: hypothetical protein HY898_14020 [Deltaproteobacteria bacterium]|nr:hypothetical protein [Deltaproteobacteria bacterium]
MSWMDWLARLGMDADPSKPGFQPQTSYLVTCLVMPIAIGLLVGVGLRVIEKIFNVELGKGGH